MEFTRRGGQRGVVGPRRLSEWSDWDERSHSPGTARVAVERSGRLPR